MEHPIERYFRVGLIAAMADPAYAQDPVGIARRIACDAYFHAIELNPIADDGARRAVTRLLRQSHLTVCYGAQARLLGAKLNPNDPDESGRKAAEETLLAGVDEAVELGSGGMAFLAGKWTPETREVCLAQLRKTALAVCRYAAEKGVWVELEVFDHDIDKAALIGPAPLAAAFAAEMRGLCQNFGLMVDLSHIPMCREDPVFTLRTLRPWITHFHMGNTVIADPALEAYGDEHPRFGFPGSENDTPQLLRFLRALGEEGFCRQQDPMVLSFEVKPRPGEDVGAVIANSKRVLNRAWALA